ncbi:MAG: DUF6499 domain-containing protein [Pseudomonadota bacterium]
MDWRRAEDYAFAADLDAAGWAWQFLRRCPEYRADHAWFIATWRALETDYGTPPTRDYFHWKQDPRAWRTQAGLAGCSLEACPGEGDQVLIECWMGEKWGFRKFPPDPAEDFPPDLTWRHIPIPMLPLANDAFPALAAGQVALAFDLELPLGPQLEAARQELARQRHALTRAGHPPFHPGHAAPRWTLWLRLLDALAAGAEPETAGQVMNMADPVAEASAARRMGCHDYRRILRLIEQTS